jgi:hypothetical protein
MRKQSLKRENTKIAYREGLIVTELGLMQSCIK